MRFQLYEGNFKVWPTHRNKNPFCFYLWGMNLWFFNISFSEVSDHLSMFVIISHAQMCVCGHRVHHNEDL